MKLPASHEFRPQTLRDVGVLVLLRPEQGLAREEVDALEKWIDDGHALVVVPGDESGLHGRNLKLARDDGPHNDEYLQGWFDWATLGGATTPTPPSPFRAKQRESSPSRPEADSPLTAGLSQLAAPPDRRFAAKSPFRGFSGDEAAGKVFWQDESGAIGVEARSGRGTIVALADDYPFTNVGLSEAQNGLLLANVVRELSSRYPGNVAFDEYHLGFAERDASPVAIARLMLAGPWRWAAMQAALVGALAMFGQAVRFGKPLDVVRKLRRQDREFAEAAGRLFEEAGAASLAAETLYRYYRERLAKRLFLDPQIDDGTLCDALERHAGSGAAARLRHAQSVLKSAIGSHKLLSLTQELHRVTETLEHGT